MSKIAAIITGKCPRCQEGDMFESPNPYNLNKLTTTNSHCSNCGIKFEREPGYFYGAMYVSYGINIALFITALVIYYLFFEDSISGLAYMIGYVGLTVLLFPVIFRLSRAVWLSTLVKYQPKVRGEY